MKFSIIIPVYNAEKYLSNSISSILAQTYDNWELILINDGPSDRSAEICLEYSNKNEKIRFINKSNTGVSDTRNVGISNSTGEKIIFLDADDYVSKNFLEELYQADIGNKYELIACNYNIISENSEYKARSITEKDIKSKKEITNKLINFSIRQSQWDKKNWYGNFRTVWCKCFCSSILKENDINFIPNLKYGEDMVFVLKYLTKISSVKFIDKYLYYYRINPTSAMSSRRWNGSEQGEIYFYEAEKVARDYVDEEALADLWLETAGSDWDVLFKSQKNIWCKCRILRELFKSELYQRFSKKELYANSNRRKRAYAFCIRNKYALILIILYAIKNNILKKLKAYKKKHK